jgi:hypothetical protein
MRLSAVCVDSRLLDIPPEMKVSFQESSSVIFTLFSRLVVSNNVTPRQRFIIHKTKPLAAITSTGSIPLAQTISCEAALLMKYPEMQFL